MSTEPAPAPQPTNADIEQAIERLRNDVQALTHVVKELANHAFSFSSGARDAIDDHGQRIKSVESELYLVKNGVAPTERPPNGAA